MKNNVKPSGTYSTTYFRNAGNKAVHMKYVHDPLASLNNDSQEHIDGQQNLEPEDCDIQIKLEEHEDFAIKIEPPEFIE